MRTEDDLRAVFTEIADEFDTRHEVADSHEPVRSVRRVLVRLTLAAAVAAIVAVGAVIAIGSSTRQPGVSAAPDPVLFAADASLADLPTDARWTETGILRGRLQSLIIEFSATVGEGSSYCVVTVGFGSAPTGDFEDTGGTTVGSIPARIGRGDPWSAHAPNAGAQLRVRWQPAADRWADASCPGETGTLPTARRLGESLRLGAATAFSVPWAAVSLPLDLQVNEVTRQPRASAAPRVTVDLFPGLGSTYKTPGENTATRGLFVALEPLADYEESNGYLRDKAKQLDDLDGRQVWLITQPDEHVQISLVQGNEVLTLGGTGLSQAEILEVVRSMTLATDFGGEQTWGPLADLPW